MQPKVSIITPVYNLASYVVQTIKSFQGQTLADFEAILVDDGSTDDSLDIIRKSIADDNRFVVVTQHNVGAAAARNHGLALATGETVIFLDGDDLFMPDLLEKTYALYRRYDLDMCFFAWQDYDVDKNALKKTWSVKSDFLSKKVFSSLDCCDVIFQLTTTAPWSRLIKRDFINEYNLHFDEKTGPCNDAYFTLLTSALAKRIAILDDVLLYYLCNRSGSYTKQFSHLVATDFIETRLRAMRYLQDNNLYAVVKESFIKNFLSVIEYRYSRSTQKAIKVMNKRLKYLFSNELFEVVEMSAVSDDYYIKKLINQILTS